MTGSFRGKQHRGRARRLGVLALLLGILLGLNLRQELEEGLPGESLSLSGDHPAGVTRVLAADGRLVATLFTENRKPVPWEGLGESVVQALLSVEDHRFELHSGVDWQAVIRAAWRNLGAGEVREGASTLTMQLARELYLGKERSWRRKAQEVLLARRLEKLYSKREILTAYLNEMYFGGGAYGIGAASSRLFGKTPSQLSVAQAALLVGLLQSPSHLNPALNPEGALARQREVLERMRSLGKLSATEYRAAVEEPISFAGLPERETPMLKYPYFTTYALSTVAREVGEQNLYRQALTIQTSLDIEAQRLLENCLKETLREEGPRWGVDAGAVVLIDNQTGSIRAMAGGAEWTPQDQFNRAWQARRQAGSSFKPFLYTAALEAGYQPFSPLLDAPLASSGLPWIPANADGRGLGQISLRQALVLSRNQATAQLVSSLGPHSLTELCGRFGFLSEMPEVPSLALGSGAVTPLEMATAYSVFPNQGWLVESHAVIEAVDDSGRRLVDHRFPWISQATGPAVAAQMTDLLLEAVASGTGGAAAVPGLSVAGKTGTTDGHRDAWFVGFTPGYTMAVWLGNDDNSGSAGLYGGQLPARLFGRIARELEQPQAYFSFLEGEPIQLLLCSRSHQPVGAACRSTYVERTYLPLPAERVGCQQCHPTHRVQMVLLEETPEAFPAGYLFEPH
jgi:penicillin-binding protein 1A